MKVAAIGAALLAGGCMMDVTPSAANPCDADAAQSFIGKPAGEAAAARVASGARDVRTIRPGDMVTMDYRVDRLNVELDEAGTIKAIRCG